MEKYLEMIRPKNCAMASFATLIGFLIASFTQNIIFFDKILIGLIAVFAICGGGQVINDVFDSKIDRKKFNINKATYFSLELFAIGIILSIFINFTAFMIASVFSLVLICYSAFLYKIKYAGNVIVALGTAFTLIFGAAITGTIPLLIIILSVSAFFANMAREITKDFEDLKKDKGVKKTLPMISKKYSKGFVVAYHLLSIIFGLIAYFAFSLNILFLGFFLVSAMIFINASNLLLKDYFNKSQKYDKIGMLISLIAFLVIIL